MNEYWPGDEDLDPNSAERRVSERRQHNRGAPQNLWHGYHEDADRRSYTERRRIALCCVTGGGSCSKDEPCECCAMRDRLGLVGAFRAAAPVESEGEREQEMRLFEECVAEVKRVFAGPREHVDAIYLAAWIIKRARAPLRASRAPSVGGTPREKKEID